MKKLPKMLLASIINLLNIKKMLENSICKKICLNYLIKLIILCFHKWLEISLLTVIFGLLLIDGLLIVFNGLLEIGQNSMLSKLKNLLKKDVELLDKLKDSLKIEISLLSLRLLKLLKLKWMNLNLKFLLWSL